MTLEQLKSRAYDLLVIIQNAQNELNQVNETISRQMVETVTEVPTTNNVVKDVVVSEEEEEEEEEEE